MISEVLSILFSLLPVKQKKILFISHLGKGYGCNPKYICEHIRRCHPKEYKLHWLYDPTCSNADEIPDGVKSVSLYSWQFRYDILTCGVLIANTRIPEWFGFKNRKGQRYIQTWHSSLRLKKIEGDANLGSSYEALAKEDSRKTDIIISGSRFSSEIIKRAFWYSGPILEVGTPRIDYLLNQDGNNRRDLLAKAGLDLDSHYILYAPTFRKNGNITSYDIDYEKLSSTLVGHFGGSWKILYRLHPNLRGKVSFKPHDDIFLDMSDYPDMQELLVIADILITDFSSCMFDMAFIQKPCILYASDLEHYQQTERNLYFTISELPFPIATTNEELNSIINSFEFKTYKQAIITFLNRIGSFELGNASEMIYNYIKQI